MLTEAEKTIMMRVEERSNKWIKWLPLKWSVNLINEMKKKKLIGNQFDSFSHFPLMTYSTEISKFFFHR